MKIIDISWPLSPNATAYKDKAVIRFQATKEFATDKTREMLITVGSHSGTHVDAPAHFIEQGGTVDSVDLGQLVGPCMVLDLTHVQEKITRADIESFDIQTGSRILCKTTNSMLDATAPFNPQFIYIDASAAQYLVAKNVAAIGVDYLGIERNQQGRETHLAFLSKNIPIIEGLRLKDVPAGIYFLCCLPLNMIGLDAAPARVVLIDGL